MHERENEGKAVGHVQTMGGESPRMPHSPEGFDSWTCETN